jgi:murein DD-endopeptidase MepM/ murein hydrolase activator NlpD
VRRNGLEVKQKGPPFAGVIVKRASDTTSVSFASAWPGPIKSGGRWAILTGALSTLIVGSIAWLAVSTMPQFSGGRVENAGHGFLPYRLFEELTKPGANSAPARSRQAAPHREAASRPTVENHTITLDSGDTLAGALENAGISDGDANAAIAALVKIYNVRSLRAGQSFEVAYDTRPDVANANNPTSDDDDDGDLNHAQAVPGEAISRLISIRFSPSVEHDIAIVRNPEGVFQATDTVKQLVAQTHRAGGTIDGSFYASAMRAGIPYDVVDDMGKMFSYKVDFQRDIHPGDAFEVFYDYYYTKDGKPARHGAISYAMLRLGQRLIALYRYQSSPNDSPEYFDAHGESVKGMLMKTPVDGARITSGFGMRFHPVLGYSRMHKGVDFGVPIGTPVMAAGGGTIAFIGWENGYGRFVMVNHSNGYSTAYGHLSRFAPGLHVGSRVRQAQIIAFSGNTGMSTGPHLHYEIRVNNQQVNPVTVRMAQGRKLAGRDLRAFQSERLRIDDMLAGTRLETHVGDVAENLRSGGTR